MKNGTYLLVIREPQGLVLSERHTNGYIGSGNQASLIN